jgi:hypothetical protein
MRCCGLAEWLQLRAGMWTRTRLGLTLAVGLLLLSGSAGIDPGELTCEDAVKHLLDCCGDGNSAVRNVSCYEERGCGDARPELDPELASCLRQASCEELYASGACADPKTSTCGR